MIQVLSPYLRGGGAKAYNFQALSQDLLSATLEIPFSVPPYMALLARSVASLEGIALVGDPNYQMVTQVHPHEFAKTKSAETLFDDLVCFRSYLQIWLRSGIPFFCCPKALAYILIEVWIWPSFFLEG